MEISIKSLYEPLDIDIDTGRGTVRVAAEVDVTPTNLARLAQACTAAQNKMGAIEALMSKGRETDSIAKIAGQRQDRRRPPRRADRGHRRGLLRGAARRGQRPRGLRRRLHARDGPGVPRGAGDRQGPQRPGMDEKAAHYLPEERPMRRPGEPDPAA